MIIFKDFEDQESVGGRGTSSDNNVEGVRKTFMNELPSERLRMAIKYLTKFLNSNKNCYKLLNEVNNDPDLLKRVIAGDTAQVQKYDVKPEAQWSQRRHLNRQGG